MLQMSRWCGMFKKILFFFSWVIGTAMSLIAAYWFMGAIPYMEEDIGYFERLLNVLKSPFADYFNNYTPIGMILAFIIVEFFFGVIFIAKIMEKPADLSDNELFVGKETPKIEFVSKPIKESESQIEFVSQTLPEVKALSTDNGKKEDLKSISQKHIEDDDTKDVFMEDKMFLKLFNSGYSMEQINAMMELTLYLPFIDARQLMKMVNPSMAADELRSYIDMFFGQG